LVCCPFNTFRG